MCNCVIDAALLVAAYLFGSVPFGFIIAKYVGGVDIRTVGSGNIGATNVGRVMGRRWGVLVFILDLLKGFLPTWVALLLHHRGLGATDIPLPVVLVGAAAVAGHNWPLFLGFHGGQ